ncbi:MAG TPA: transcriptional regulator [Inquilinus sp.]
MANDAYAAQLAAGWPDAPDWARTLAEACDRDGQATVARKLAVSPSLVSYVRRGLYGRDGHAGDLAMIEAKVRGAYMGATTSCPVQGEIPTDRCVSNQALPLSTASRARVELFRACRSGCPHSRIGGKNAQ